MSFRRKQNDDGVIRRFADCGNLGRNKASSAMLNTSDNNWIVTGLSPFAMTLALSWVITDQGNYEVLRQYKVVVDYR